MTWQTILVCSDSFFDCLYLAQCQAHRSPVAARAPSPSVQSWTQSKSLLRDVLINDRIPAAMTEAVLFFSALYKEGSCGVVRACVTNIYNVYQGTKEQGTCVRYLKVCM